MDTLSGMDEYEEYEPSLYGSGYSAAELRERSSGASPHGILRRHGKSAASLREKLSGATAGGGGGGGGWIGTPVGTREGVPVRARVQVARLLDILTTESHVLEAQLERQLEAQLEALAGVQSRSASRLQGDSPPARPNGSTRTSPASVAAPTAASPPPGNNDHEHGGPGSGANGAPLDTSQTMSLREKVEMRGL